MANFGKKLFWRCAGVTVSVLEQPGCETDHNKHAAIGATVLLTGILAGLSGGYAFYRAFGTYRAAIPLGIFWGLLILNLDRFMVMSIKKKDVPTGNWRAWLKAKSIELLASLPRLLLAFLLALVIAKPLELKLFQPEIDLEVQSLKRDMADAMRKMSAQSSEQYIVDSGGKAIASDRIKMLQDQNDKLKGETSTSYQDWQRLNELARKEREGESGTDADDLTGRRGPGTEYRNRQAAADGAKKHYEDIQRLNSTQIAQNETELEALRATQTRIQQDTSATLVATDGLAIRLAALSQLTSKDEVAPYNAFGVYRLQGAVYRYANLGIIAIIALLELAPILSKIFVSYGSYDRAVEAAEEKAKLLAEMEQLKLETAIEALKGSRAKRLKAVLDIQDAMLDDLKEEIRNVTQDSQIARAELDEMKRVLVRQAIADLRKADGDGQQRQV